MNIFNSIKTKLIVQISILIIISTIFVLILVNLVTQQRPAGQPMTFNVDYSLTQAQQREYFQRQIDANVKRERAENAALLLAASILGIFTQISFTSVGTYFLIKKELKPLEDLNKTIQDINESLMYLQILEDPNASEEISNLISNFNQMIGRLEKAFKGQKQFVENVSHEIKTPLTIIKSNLESIIIDNDISNEDRDLSINSSIESINFLNKLVEDLLLLSFIDKKQIKTEKIKLTSLIDSVIHKSDILAKSQELSINLKSIVSKNTEVKVNEILLERAIANLVENAIKYSKSKSNIDIELLEKKDKVIIKISNVGDEIEDEYKTKIFERFFRIDRSRTKSTGGLGLGLAISKEILEVFKGKISVSSAHGLNTFSIELPISD